MYKLCKTEQSARRQWELEHGLLNAMTAKRYEDISISDLCDQLELPRKSFYRYFSGKDGALHALLDHTLQACSWYIDDSTTIDEAFTRYFRFWLEQKPLLDALQLSGMSGILIQRAVCPSLSRSLSLHLVQNQTSLSRPYALHFLICGIMSVVLQWHHEGCAETPEEMSRTVSQLLTEPVFSL